MPYSRKRRRRQNPHQRRLRRSRLASTWLGVAIIAFAGGSFVGWRYGWQVVGPPPGSTAHTPAGATQRPQETRAGGSLARPATVPADAFQAIVTRVVDGDTFAIRYDDEETRVRIAGIDAWEKSDPGGPEATAALTAMIDGRAV